VDGDRLLRMIEAIRDNLETLADAGEYLRIFDDDRYGICPDAAHLLETGEAKRVLRAAYEALMRMGDDDTGPFEKWIGAVKERTGLKGKAVFMPLRAALTGRVRGPELDRIFALLGRDSLLKRLAKVL